MCNRVNFQVLMISTQTTHLHFRQCCSTTRRNVNTKPLNTAPLTTTVSRRNALWTILSPVLIARTGPAFGVEAPEVQIRPELAPDASDYDSTDPRLREAAERIQEALSASDVIKEEQIWTEIIDQYSTLDANWVPEVVGRAIGNRGNARYLHSALQGLICSRSRQGKMDAALEDFNKAIELCPWSVDPVLNRGVVLESLGRFDEAIRDYRVLLSVAPYDPASKE